MTRSEAADLMNLRPENADDKGTMKLAQTVLYEASKAYVHALKDARRFKDYAHEQSAMRTAAFFDSDFGEALLAITDTDKDELLRQLTRRAIGGRRNAV